ncbi:MAG: histidinol dehydrogenase, partial [Maribacter sp.]|nr:histidinol dehydrogenase [Maribacter sp.]
MNKIYNPKREDWEKVLKRPTQTVSDIENMVNTIFTEVQGFGDSIVKKYTQKFDNV